MLRHVHSILKDTKGATAVEYGLIVALIFIAMITGINSFADVTVDMWNRVADEVEI